MAKTLEDIKRVIENGKPLAVIQKFYDSWKTEEAYRQAFDGDYEMEPEAYWAWKRDLVESYVPPAIDPTNAIIAISEYMRARRDVLLSECDWTQSNDSPLNDASKTAYVVYRQSLRDVTDDADFPFVAFPVKP